MHLHLNKWSIVLIYQLWIAIQSDENHSPLNKDPFFLNDQKHFGTEYLVQLVICAQTGINFSDPMWCGIIWMADLSCVTTC